MAWYKERKAQLGDFVKFGRAMVLSGDIDPQFPTLSSLYKQLKLDPNTALWYTCVYLVFYHLGSATHAWGRYPTPDIIKASDWQRDLPYTKQRRCFRGNDEGRTQLNSLLEASDGDLHGWITKIVGDGGEEGWARAREAFTEIPYHGPWSSYKLCDMVKFVHGFPITAPDIGTKPGDTAGPIAGLSSLTGFDRKRCTEDTKLHRTLLKYAQDNGAPLNGLDQLESVLCDWQSINFGRYYLVHDIDRDLGQIATAEPNLAKRLMRTRRKLFDERTLGELNGWNDIRLDLNSVYRNRRRLIHNFSDVKVVEMIPHG